MGSIPTHNKDMTCLGQYHCLAKDKSSVEVYPSLDLPMNIVMAIYIFYEKQMYVQFTKEMQRPQINRVTKNLYPFVQKSR